MHSLWPMVVVQSGTTCVYEEWQKDGPAGARYEATKNGWFEKETFTRWFFEVHTVYK